MLLHGYPDETLTGRCEIDAACYENKFDHSLNPDLAALRKFVPIEHGYWYFEVDCVPKSELSFEEFAGKHASDDDDGKEEWKNEIAENINYVLEKSMSVAELLFEPCSTFGMFRFEGLIFEIGPTDGPEIVQQKCKQFETTALQANDLDSDERQTILTQLTAL